MLTNLFRKKHTKKVARVHRLIIPNEHGDTQVEFDPDAPADVRRIRELVRARYASHVKLDPEGRRVLRTFEPAVARTILLAPVAVG